MPEYRISVLLSENQGIWLAQCLEYDIAVEAKSLEDVSYELERTLVGHLVICDENNEEPFERIPPAPQEYWQRYARARMRLMADVLPFRLPKQTSRHRLPTPDFRIAAASLAA